MVNLVKRGESYYTDIYLPSTGKRIRKSLGKVTRKEAEALLEEIASDYLEQENGYLLDDLICLYSSPETNPRFRSAKAEGIKYSKSHALQVAALTKQITKAISSKYPKLLKTKISKLSNIDARHIRQSIYDSYGASRKAQYCFVCLKAMFTQAQQEGWITSNPFALMKGINYEPKQKTALEPKVIKKLMSMDFRSYEEFAYFSILATTGMRKSEVLALNKEQIYQGTLTIDRSVKSSDKDDIQKPKWDVVRIIPLSKTTLCVLDKLTTDKNGRYFNRSRHWADEVIQTTKKTAQYVFPDIAEEVKQLTSHVLRHSLTTNLLTTGTIPEAFICEYMGWEHQHMLVMQRNYTHLKAQHLEPVAEAIDKMFK